MSLKIKRMKRFKKAIREYDANFLLAQVIAANTSTDLCKKMLLYIDEMGWKATKQFIEIAQRYNRDVFVLNDKLPTNKRINESCQVTAMNTCYSCSRCDNESKFIKRMQTQILRNQKKINLILGVKK